MQVQLNNRVRKRGIVLTDRGLRKLNLAKINAENERGFKRYTLESLSEKTGLTPTTLSKIFTGSAGVDKRTLKLCFEVFDLTLVAEDFFYPSDDRGDRVDFEWESREKTFAAPESVLYALPISRTLNMARSPDALPPLRFAVPGGQLPLDSVLYIDRPVLESLCYEAIDGAGASLNIRAPKQMGKSSLMTRILVRARSANYHAVSVSLQLAEAETLQNLERFLQWFCTRVSKELGSPNSIGNVWNPVSGSKANATDYFEEVLLSRIDRPLILAIDELDQLFAYPDIAREFLLLLRNWSERAKAAVLDSDPWYKLRLVTVHSTEVLLPGSIAPSLLNAGLAIDLPEFTAAQTRALAERYEQKFTPSEIDRLIAFLGGHPYRLQLAFYYFQQGTITLEELVENAEIAIDLYAEHLQQQWWNLQRYPHLQDIFAEIVRLNTPIECEAELSFPLQKMGLVRRQGDKTSLACELFRLFFRERPRRRNE